MIMCMRASHGRHFSFFLTVVMESQMTYATRNSAEDSRTGSHRFMPIARRKCPRACASSDIHFRRRHDLLKPCEKGHRRSVRLVNHLCVAVRGNYSSQLSIRDPNVMNYRKSSSYSTTGLTLKKYTNVMCLLRLTDVIFNCLKFRLNGKTAITINVSSSGVWFCGMMYIEGTCGGL